MMLVAQGFNYRLSEGGVGNMATCLKSGKQYIF